MFSIIYKIAWAISTSIIVLASIYFTKKLKFAQFNIKKMTISFKTKSTISSGLKPLDSLMLTLAGRIGVGSIAGVALGIYIGGPGTIFWIWVTTFLVAILSYAETYLGIKYREEDENKNYLGGPSYYIKNGLGYNVLSSLYAILIIICYIGGFLGIQSNTITKMFIEIIPLSKYIVVFILSLLSFFCIFGGIKSISKITSKLVPFMTLLYIFLFCYVCFTNYSKILLIFIDIVKSAFSMKSVFGGFLSTCIIGLQRGIFSNEAGLGTSSIASSTSYSSASNQGYLEVVGVYVTSLILCTATAIFILTTNYNLITFADFNGIELMSYAFSYHFGTLGNILLFLFIFLFAFSTILTGYYYGEASLRFLIGNKYKKIILILKIITIVVIFFGGVVSSTFLWNFVDLLVAFLAIINITVIFLLRDNIFK